MNRPILITAFFFLILSTTVAQEAESQYFYTYQQATGNKYIEGSGTFPDVITHDVVFGSSTGDSHKPVWIVGAATDTPQWFGISEDNLPGVLSVQDSSPTFDLLTMLPSPEKPPILSESGQPIPLLSNDEAPNSHPVPFGEGWLYVSRHFDLVYLVDGEEAARLTLQALPDARIVINSSGQAALYTNASNQRYVHGIMGDDVEGASLVIVSHADNTIQVDLQIDLPGDAVYEGIYPMWADIDGDDSDDLITTISDSSIGSRIRVYRFTEEGILEADGPAIGRPGRWQHQLAVAPFGPDGETELVEVLTPHIGGVVRFYQLINNQMEIVAQYSGYTSHMIGSRNLDMAIAGDFNGDGTPELVLPAQNLQQIGAIQRNQNGAELVWRLPLEGRLTSNLAAITSENRLMLAAGTHDGRIRLWMKP